MLNTFLYSEICLLQTEHYFLFFKQLVHESKCVQGNAITFNYAYWHFEHFRSYFPFFINTLSIFNGFGYFD